MATDYLDQLLDAPAASANAELEPDDIAERKYVAYKIGRTPECELRTVKPFQHGLPFSYTYTTIAFTGDNSFFWTITSFFVLKVKGRNLRPIVRAMRRHAVLFLQEFDERAHDIPDDRTAPVITQIDIVIQPAAASYKEASEEYGPAPALNPPGHAQG